jgi:streptogramin lyase
MRIGLVVAGVVCAVGLAGCSGGVVGGVEQQAASSSAGVRLTGVVHGGQNPISGARVYLLAAASGAGGAGAAAYGGSGIAASSNNASVSLLTSAGNTTQDQNGTATNGDYYVTTDSGGNFSITGDYSCTAGQQVYLYALGGNPGLGTGANAAAGLMAALGNCPGGSSAFAAGTPYVVVNEVSTVAAAYAMAGFATDALHVGSSGTALALTGIANAFAIAGNLETLSTGMALSFTNGVNDPTMLDTLADILAACVNSTGAVTGPANATPCYTLFTNAMSGGLTGTQPTDTATAAINIAHNPQAAPATLFGLVGSSPPFVPAAPFSPLSFMISIAYAGGTIPGTIAIDSAGNVWTTQPSYGVVFEYSNLGKLLSPGAPFGFSGGGMNLPRGLAIDQAGNVWIANNGGNSVTELSNSGTPSAGSPYTDPSLNSPNSVAIDGLGNIWIANAGANSLTELTNSGSAAPNSPFTGGGLSSPGQIAIDNAGNVWTPNTSASSVTELTSTGTPVSGSPYTGGGLDKPYAIAIDSSGSAWVTSYTDNKLTKLSSSGSILIGSEPINYPAGVAIDGAGNAWFSGTSGSYSCCSYLLGLSNSGNQKTDFTSYPGGGVAVDGSGNVWYLYEGGVLEYVGAGTPVVTPLSVAVQSAKVGTRP